MTATMFLIISSLECTTSCFFSFFVVVHAFATSPPGRSAHLPGKGLEAFVQSIAIVEVHAPDLRLDRATFSDLLEPVGERQHLLVQGLPRLRLARPQALPVAVPVRQDHGAYLRRLPEALAPLRDVVQVEAHLREGLVEHAEDVLPRAPIRQEEEAGVPYGVLVREFRHGVCEGLDHGVGYPGHIHGVLVQDAVRALLVGGERQLGPLEPLVGLAARGGRDAVALRLGPALDHLGDLRVELGLADLVCDCVGIGAHYHVRDSTAERCTLRQSGQLSV
mmetsp:Transcript_26692/g.75403  ORF Transcript_26692/g.75403 Transcript_26692/m.75403 type:complete len:277 (-) Transcript_26692:36-866(-)